MVTSLSREDRILGSVKPFRLSSAIEIATLRRVFIRVSKLQTGQFAENGFGFPFMPFPVIDNNRPDRTKLSPDNIDERFLFHPIYWVDPRLTSPTEEELSDPARWSIRMFYELLSFGLINPETLQWLNPAAVKGVVYNAADVNSLLNDAPSVLDKVIFRDEDRLPEFSSSDVLEAADTALEKIRAMQQREINRIRSLRDVSINEAEKILSGNDNWADIFARLEVEAAGIDTDRSRNQPIASHVDAIYGIKEAVSRYLASGDDIIVGLSYDIADNVSYSNESVIKFAAIASLLKRGKGLISKAEAEIDRHLNGIFNGSSGVSAGSIVAMVSQMHADMIDRLSLAYRNYQLTTSGQKPIRSVEAQMFDETARTQQASESDFN